MKKTVIIIISFLLISIASVAAYYDIVDIEGKNDLVEKNDIIVNENIIGIVENDYTEIKQEEVEESNQIKQPEQATQTSNDLSICNEDGEIMILMYHKFAKNSNGDVWTRSFDDFKNDLEVLYKNNYRPISMTDYLTNNIDVPYGMTPVVLTFDDGSAGQLAFEWIDDELVIKENTAVKIMQDFNQDHPDFKLKGTFYITGTNFFGAKGTFTQRLTYLTDLGFEIGNLTKSHYALGNADTADKVIEEVGGFVKFLDEYLPGYKVNSLSLPGGSRSKSFEKYMYEGEYEGFEYVNKGVVSIYNSFPAKSPTNSEVNFKNIPRIKVSDDKKGLEYWIEYFKEHPGEKYISDGKN